jgi:TolB-like protein
MAPARQDGSIQIHSQPTQSVELPRKPSIAVLPFANLSGDVDQNYFIDGIVEEITTALSHFSWLFVIARGSSFTYKGRDVDAKQIGRELDVQYLLEGSVRKSSDRVRITAQLIDALTGMHLWADRYDGSLKDIFELQDQVTASVVGALGPKLEQAEIDRAKRKPTDSLDAYDYFLRGLASTLPYARDGVSEGLRLFYRAIELDPDYAAAHGLAAWCFVHRKTHGWMEDRPKEIAEAARLGRRAVDLGSHDAVALCFGGFALAYVAHELDDGVAHVDQSLVLNPNLAVAWASSGWLRVYLGEPEQAIGRFAQAMRLSPLDPLNFRVEAGMGYSHFFMGRYDEGSIWLDRSLRARPNYLTAVRGAIVSHALAGRIDKAQQLMSRMRTMDSTLRVSNLKELLPLRRPEDIEKWEEGLRMAGLPE